MRRDPLVLVDVVRLGLVMAAAFGLAIDKAQIDAVVAFVGALVGFLGLMGVTAWLRARLTPVAAPQLPAGTQVVVTTTEGHPLSTQTLTG